MKYLADPKYDGTMERRIALVLDRALIYINNRSYVLDYTVLNMDDLVTKLAAAMRDENEEPLNESPGAVSKKE